MVQLKFTRAKPCWEPLRPTCHLPAWWTCYIVFEISPLPQSSPHHQLPPDTRPFPRTSIAFSTPYDSQQLHALPAVTAAALSIFTGAAPSTVSALMIGQSNPSRPSCRPSFVLCCAKHKQKAYTHQTASVPELPERPAWQREPCELRLRTLRRPTKAPPASNACFEACVMQKHAGLAMMVRRLCLLCLLRRPGPLQIPPPDRIELMPHYCRIAIIPRP